MLYSLFLIVIALSNLDAQIDRENEFIYSLIKFTNWEDYVLKSEEPFLIGVYKSQTDFECMEAFFRNKKCFNKNIRVENIFSFESIYDFDIIYLPENQSKQDKDIIDLCIDYDIISISSNNSTFCKKGGIINLINSKTEYKIQINNSVAIKNNIFFSPQLLNIVEIVE